MPSDVMEKKKPVTLDDVDVKLTGMDGKLDKLISQGNTNNTIEKLIKDGFAALTQLINEWGQRLMATLQQFQEALSQVDAETTRISNYIADILAQLTRTDLTEAEEAELLTALTAAKDRLKTVGASVETPVPAGDTLPALKKK